MTYSIVARDPATSEIGVAVQSHYFSVGSVVPWAEAGVGGVATQASAEISYGPKGLDRMRAGESAEAALRALVAADTNAARRQVAMVDARGGVAAHTGERCIPHAGHRIGDNVSVQANMMERDTVPDAMLAAYNATAGALPARLLAALDAAEAEGGDIRGRQSAAMLVVSGTPSGNPWADRVLELRVEDHPEPLIELRRLIDLHRAYKLLDEAERAGASGDAAAAAPKVIAALQLAPGNAEIAAWAALGAASAGQIDVARQLFAQVTAQEPRWRELVRRLRALGDYDLPDDTWSALLGG
ncbi:MAG TPA: DUF1028 domain-containing protein [Dehalococcoidia bacterium]|nr:DUF1028 domain-containing protein [Dehalococcoidia bacterium]